MGGPWKDRRFDAAAWRPPARRTEPFREPARPDSGDSHLIGVVIGYIASVLTSIGIILAIMKYGW